MPRTLDVMQQSQMPQQAGPQQSGMDAFSSAILQKLQEYQRKSTEGSFNAQGAQNNRISAQTSPDLIGASPNVQSSVRNASAQALNPTIQGQSNNAKSFQDLIGEVRQFTTDYQQTQEKLKSSARDNLLLALQIGGAEGLNAVKQADPNIFKLAGLDEETLIHAAKSKELAARATGSSSNINSDNERALLSQFNGLPIVKDYNTILGKKLSVDSILNSGVGGPGDLAAVYEFMKALDPSSVVRETEYATAARSGNIFQGIYAKYNGYLKENGGFLPDSVKQSFKSIIDSKLKVQQTLYDNTKKQYEGLASRQGLNPSNVVIDYGAAYTPNSASGGSSFDDIQSQISIEGKNAYLPRSVWSTLGSRQDALLAEAAADGYTLLIR